MQTRKHDDDIKIKPVRVLESTESLRGDGDIKTPCQGVVEGGLSVGGGGRSSPCEASESRLGKVVKSSGASEIALSVKESRVKHVKIYTIIYFLEGYICQMPWSTKFILI